MTLDVRNATPGDALQMTAVHKRSREAYYAEALDPVDAAHDRYPMWVDTLTRTDTWCVVAVQDGDLAGFVAAHLVERDDSPAELLSLYVDPDRFGSGIGSVLHNRFVEVVPSGTAELEVWDGNDRAKSLHSHRGWRPTTRSRPGVAGMPFVTWTLDLRPSVRPNTVR
ncbi:GNAT family N-acetyltransferase [Curtobacterium flaccumfaciens]|uniref:GNAT family N-acetyltransferase n=1 Tax=Curtobacterium poinsettiae TaxID=159612 RepID=A0A9Q9T417_9MICO|nr:GNAT family N-acetyltransferase [Curtobacterium flaccumfaciens]UXN26555.1 GNAT family N-acetyltransferase [Curtobacterium flaccumfaciens]UYC81397.1 GNAT family N-acetyltransferase [Curtobacterium flaccumfaciens pv. poinsettiae]